MITRWRMRQWLQIGLVVLFIGALLYVGAGMAVSYSRDLPVAHGATLPTPEPEPDPGLISQFADDHTRSWTVTAEVHPDHSATITETIVQVFELDRHGIERRIPLEDDLGVHRLRSLEVATSAGASDQVSVTDIDGGVAVRIGDPDVTITGVYAYRLTYVMEHLVDDAHGTPVVRLDAVNDWQQDIDALDATITADGAPTTVACFQGPFGSTTPCATATPTAGGGTFVLGGTLPAGQAFTYEADYPTGTFDPTATVTDQSDLQRLALLTTAGMLAAVLLGFLITVVRARASRRRAAAAAGLGAIGDNEAPLEFEPPLGMSPAEMLRLRDTWRVEVPDMLAATLVQMAADGVVHLTRDGDDWQVTRVDTPPRPLHPHEEIMVASLLGKKDERSLSTQDAALCNAIPRFVRSVDEQLHHRGLTTEKKLHFGMEGRSYPWTMGALTCFVATIVAAIAFFVGAKYVDPTWLVLGLGGVVVAIVLAMSIRRDVARLREYTDAGRAGVWRVEGFQRFFRDSEAIHARAAGRLGMFREYMGHAVAFAAVDRWLAAMPTDVAAAMTDPNQVITPAALADVSKQRVYRAAATRYASRSVSRGGGSSSGSRSSGGGSGGGGGGSW